MACAALMDQQLQPMYFPLLDTPSTPGVRNLQILIERAWRDGKSCSVALRFYSLSHTGYDQEGAEDMKRDLVDSCKWIGTAGMCPLCFPHFDKPDPYDRVICCLHIQRNTVSYLFSGVLKYGSLVQSAQLVDFPELKDGMLVLASYKDL